MTANALIVAFQIQQLKNIHRTRMDVMDMESWTQLDKLMLSQLEDIPHSNMYTFARRPTELRRKFRELVITPRVLKTPLRSTQPLRRRVMQQEERPASFTYMLGTPAPPSSPILL